MKRLLITSGCSFTGPQFHGHDCTWPYWLSDATGINLKNLGLGSQGNGLISRKLIYRVGQELKTRPAQELLVGIMWSGPDRWDFYHDHTDLHVQPEDAMRDSWVENPTQVVPEHSTPGAGWIICNHHWENSSSQMYYRNFHTRIGAMVQTLEHMLRTQWFLQLRGVDYFMTTFNSGVLPRELMEHAETRHLYEQLDHGKFLPIIGMEQWCRENITIDFRLNDCHPTSAHHKTFVIDFLVPHLTKQGLLC